MSNTFFTYKLINPLNDQPFYVGKGMGNRPDVHLQEARSGAKNHKCNTIRKIWKAGKEVIIEKSELMSEEQAFNDEIELIKHYGRRDLGTGILTNLTDGGEGACGVIYTDEARMNCSKWQLGTEKEILLTDDELRDIFQFMKHNAVEKSYRELSEKYSVSMRYIKHLRHSTRYSYIRDAYFEVPSNSKLSSRDVFFMYDFYECNRTTLSKKEIIDSLSEMYDIGYEGIRGILAGNRRKAEYGEYYNIDINPKKINSKLNEEDVYAILQYIKDNGRTPHNIQLMAEQYNIGAPSIRLILNGRRWTHIYNKFHNIE